LGVNMRATMDIDTTVKALPLNQKAAEMIVTEICNIQLEDGVVFKITEVSTIMDEFDYPGVRFHIQAMLDKMRNVIKLDISTDDVITPRAIEYKYKFMFEERSIFIYSYNTETLLAEKLQTIINRGIANTRLRDFYDVCEIAEYETIDWKILKKAFSATCRKRGTIFSEEKVSNEVDLIAKDYEMEKRWTQFKNKNYFVGDLEWDAVMKAVKKFANKVMET